MKNWEENLEEALKSKLEDLKQNYKDKPEDTMDSADDTKEEEDGNAVVAPSVLVPVSVDSFLSDIGEDSKEYSVGGEGGSFVSARSALSTYSSASALPEHQGCSDSTIWEI